MRSRYRGDIASKELMFALRKQNSEQASAETKSERTGASGSRQFPGRNPLWQSLALRPLRVQPKLTVSQPNDPAEREADHVAALVMRMATPASVNSTRSFSSHSSREVQRKCAPCEEEEEKKLQRKESDPQSPVGSSLAANASPGGPGRPLDSATRGFFEPRFGQDFSDVRVHDDARADASARSWNALAFTLGREVVFRAGHYEPHTQTGQRLLAHELAHVVQQRGHDQTIQRMVACPERLADSAPTPAGWQSYHGDPSWFHCGFRVILENRSPTPTDPQNECAYDHAGVLVDGVHQFAGCRGTPNQYDSAEHPLDHTFSDTGGIWHQGRPAFMTSRAYSLSRPLAAAIATVGEGVATASNVVRAVGDAFGELIALAVLNARAIVNPENWRFQGLRGRSATHLTAMGYILGSTVLNQTVENLLQSLTRRLSDLPTAQLLTDIAQDVNQALQSRGDTATRVTAADFGRLSLLHLVDWLRERGLLQYARPPEDIAREQLGAGRTTTR
jgi:hypothetical protein